MASFPKPMLTNNGLELLTKAQGGVKINFTRIGMGDGELGSRSINELNHLINEKVSVEITKGYKQSISEYVVGGYFSNAHLEVGFSWREIGIYAQDPDKGEILYSYSNARDNPDYIPGVSGGLWEKEINLHTAIGNASNVTVELASVIYVSKRDFKGHEENQEIHTTAEEKNATAQAIAKNTQDIAGNTQAISQNTTAIAQTTKDLGSHTASQATHLLTLTHSKSSTVHTLTGIPTASGIYTAQFKATADYLQGNTFNGYTAKPVGEDTAMPNKAFVTGDLVTVVVDTQSKKLGFKLGGGGVNDTLPSQVKNLTATAGNAKVTLSWTNPTTGFAGLVIMRKVGSQPTGVTDGTKVYEGTGASFIDTGVVNDTTYYYRAFPYNAKKQYQTDIVGAVVSALPRALPTDYVYLTSFNASTNWTCPESGYYQVFCFGASGKGGSSTSNGRNASNAGGGGASGGLSIHKMYMEKDTVIPITATTAITSFGNYCSATSGADASVSIGATSVGTASGGNILNAQGGAGGNGGISKNGGSDPSASTGTRGINGNQSTTINNGSLGGLAGSTVRDEYSEDGYFYFGSGGGGGGGGCYAASKYTYKDGAGAKGNDGNSSQKKGQTGLNGYQNLNTANIRLSGGGGGGGGLGQASSYNSSTNYSGLGGTGAPPTVIIEKGVYS